MPFTYNLPVWDTISMGWEKTYGVKATIWGALLILFLFQFVIGFAQGITNEANPGLTVMISFVTQIISWLLQMGIIAIGIRRAKDLPVQFSMMFETFQWEYAARIIGLYILFFLMGILIMICVLVPIFLVGEVVGITLAILIGVVLSIILMIRFALSMAFVLDQQLGPVQALKASWDATRGNFWNVFAVMALQVIFILISIIPLGIGLIWSLPFSYVTYGVMYRNLLNNIQNTAVPVNAT